MVEHTRSRPGAAGTVALLSGLTAVVDLSRCGIGLTVGGASVRLILLVATGVASALVSVIVAAGALRRRRWAPWLAAIIGIASAPQAAATGFAHHS